jgi:hypothetical protein
MPKKPISKNITKKQLAVLELLYTFRFGTSDLLARALNLKDGRYIHMRLDALVKQGYIAKKYDSSFKLAGEPAAYYLLPKAFPVLKEQSSKSISTRTLRNIYKDKEASERFIAHNIDVLTIYDKLRAIHSEHLGFWTKSKLNFDEYDYFPEPKPDAYLTITPKGVRPRDRYFFLNYLDDGTPFFVHVRRLQKYIDYVEANEWKNATGAKLRGVLLVCESTALLKRIRKKLAQLVDEDEVPRFCYTTLEALKKSTPGDDEVWQRLDRPLEVFGLEGI